MTREEFEVLTGFDFQLDAEQYRCIEEVYMTVDDDKEYFCELLKVMYKADRCTMEFMLELGRKMIAEKKKLQQKFDEQKKELADRLIKAQTERDEVYDFLYEQSDDPDRIQIRDKCKEIAGKEHFYARCMEDGRDLDSYEVDEVVEALISINQ